ncbi:hypothetical protein LS68_005195 [Helicobacter sp. MIT 05-5293]|uniref:McrB family protein n=1 Tax=Helicobacter sp. MIT 05-5293 TaxID=1548149 RepID=UPI00051D663F|nr:AAA family ATPase [Helicobacter sp. MIT 05-5293]TLD80873.1 hypothetical protein LS68_005195 [Helicobacter sp. MIT 05-5293]
MQELRVLFLEFQERWNLERVKNMTLEEYTGIGGETRDDFTYWIEYKLDLLNKYDRNPTKFGIWKNNNEEKQTNRASYNGDYGWFNSLKEKTPQQAFEKMKSYIVRLIRLSQGNHLDEIDEIVNIEKLIGDVCAWKIAFCYQNINDMRILCIFSKNILQNIAKGESLGENLSTAQIYKKLLGDKTYTLEMMIDEKFTPLWKKYNNQKQKMQESNNSSQNNLQDSKKNQIPLNQILYGPPGTGKTYQTIDRALEILLEYGEIESIPESRKEKKKKFDEYKANGQIEFITFHQSFSYEEFVEGIKPKIDESSQKMTYKVRNGIFKKICEKAENNLETSQKANTNHEPILIDYNKTLWKAYTTPGGKDYFKECYENGYLWLYEQWGGKEIQSKVSEDDYLIIPIAKHGKSKRIRAFGIFGDFLKQENGKLYRKVKWLWRDTSPEQDGVLIPETNFARKTFRQVNKGRYEVLNCVQSMITPEEYKPLNPYILIIDEINRGNISKIFGELITLIEPSKRIGENEALEVTLPYSQESFGVPNNLYIIGTMNTADRSIALLDTALRRRFEFVEMMPDCEALKNIWLVNKKGEEDSSIEEWNSEESQVLYQILKFINHRIEFLLDREHTIGHAFFFEKAKFYENERCFWYELSLKDLQAVFAKKIIPLLQEYFYEDYAKIDAVLNGNGMIKVDKEITFSKLFNSKFNDCDNEKSVYQITDSSEWGIKNFQKIYDDSIKIDDEN